MKKSVKEIEFTPNLLAQWRLAFQPKGSGPLSMMRKVVQLVEALAEAKGWDLDAETFEMYDSLWCGMERVDPVPPERALFEINEKYGKDVGTIDLDMTGGRTKLVLRKHPVFGSRNKRDWFRARFPKEFMGYPVVVPEEFPGPYLGAGI
jgi:hypothetical protein